ncbi:MAG: uroporphyrinogen decarboxylase family protein [Deferrisomatales bacterium]
MDTGRALFDSFLKGRPIPRPPYLPLLSGLMARVGGVTAEAMTADPTQWSAAAAKTADLFDLDGVAVGFDPTLLAEACGCAVTWADDRPRLGPPAGAPHPDPEERGRLAAALETARRTFPVLRARRGCAAVLTGPVALAHQLFGDEGPARLGDAKQLAVRVAEAFLKAKPDLLCCLEGRQLAAAGPLPAHRRAYSTLKNVAAYFDVPLALCVEEWTPADLAGLAQLPADLWVLGPGADGAWPTPASAGALARAGLGVGVALPLDDPGAAAPRVQEWAAGAPAGRFFLTGVEPPPGRPQMEEVHRLVRQIHAVRL